MIDDKETKVWDHQITWWTLAPYNPTLSVRLASRLDTIQQAALDMGILDQAHKR